MLKDSILGHCQIKQTRLLGRSRIMRTANMLSWPAGAPPIFRPSLPAAPGAELNRTSSMVRPGMSFAELRCVCAIITRENGGTLAQSQNRRVANMLSWPAGTHQCSRSSLPAARGAELNRTSSVSGCLPPLPWGCCHTQASPERCLCSESESKSYGKLKVSNVSFVELHMDH